MPTLFELVGTNQREQNMTDEIAELKRDLDAIDKAIQSRRDIISIYTFSPVHLLRIEGHRTIYLFMSTGIKLFMLRLRVRLALWLHGCTT